MVQGPRHPTTSHALREDATVQILRLLGIVTALDLVLRRASSAVFGLRLSEENPILRALNDIAPKETTLLDLLIVAAVLASAFVCFDLMRRTDLRNRLGGLAGLGSVAWIVAWRLEGRAEPSLPPELGLGMLLLSCALVAPSLALLPALLGASLSSLWIVLTDRGVDDTEAIEKAAEVLIAAGIFVAWPLSNSGRSGRWGVSIALLSGFLVLATCWLNPAAWRHVVWHIFDLHTAGLPTPLLAALLALAVTGLIGLTSRGPAERGLALGLFLLLASARGKEAELIALRGAAGLTIAWTWARLTPGPTRPQESAEKSSSGPDSERSPKSEASGSSSSEPAM